MTKEYQINDILSAVNALSKMDKKKATNKKNKDSNSTNDVLIHNKQAELNKSEILVLDEMIE